MSGSALEPRPLFRYTAPMPATFYNEWDLQTLRPESKKEDYRTAFQRDRDRLIYTAAFRRLQAKTQVFFAGEYDFYRTRLTHSLEVAQVGRSICDYLRQTSSQAGFQVEETLVEAICLAHDLGHPPFGHAGERTLNRLMKPYGGFEGNAQTVRIVTETIFRDGEKRRGMNPTRAFLDGVMKYKALHRSDNEAHNHFLYDEQEQYLDWVHDTAAMQEPPRSIECQIMDWADDTAYSLNDIVDGSNAGFITASHIRRWAEEQELTDEEKAHIDNACRAIQDRRAESLFGRKVGDFIRAASVREQQNALSSRSNRYRYELVVQPQVLAEARLYKKIATNLVFRSAQLQQLEHKGDHLLRRIFAAFEERYIKSGDLGLNLLPAHREVWLKQEHDPLRRARIVCDYIAGMTDGFAIRTYKRLYDPDFGSIGELS